MRTPRLLPSLSPSLERAGRRAGRDAAQDCAGAHGARGLPVLGLGGERHRHQARLVLLECGGRAAADEDHRAPHGVSRQHLRRREPVGKARHACRLRPAVCARSSTPSFPITTAATSRARRSRSSRPAWPRRSRRSSRRKDRDTIAAFFAEPVMGAGGAIVPPQRLFREDPGGAAQVRHPVRRRRGDLRLCPHRRNVGLADLRHSRPTW